MRRKAFKAAEALVCELQEEDRFLQIPDMLAVLAHDGDYSYIDRIANSQSKPLVLHYLREALRDFNSLKRNPPQEMNREAIELLQEINHDYLERELDRIMVIDDARKLREVVSYLCAKALARASGFIEQSRRARSEPKEAGES